MKRNTCCFAGDSHLPAEDIPKILINFEREIEHCISMGVTTFICRGALGFEQIAASFVIAKKELGMDIHLIFALPCRNQDKLWTREEKTFYRALLKEADDIIYFPENYKYPFINNQNYYMVEHSSCYICAYLFETSKIEQVVRYAYQRGLGLSTFRNSFLPSALLQFICSKLRGSLLDCASLLIF